MIARGLAPSYFQINNGLCEDLAEQACVMARAGGLNAFTLCTDNFTVGGQGGAWDWPLIAQWGISVPQGVSKRGARTVAVDASHVWVFHEGLHYDAECPDGVRSFFELPIFRRYIACWLREHLVPAEDVATDDVTPPPPCPAANPG